MERGVRFVALGTVVTALLTAFCAYEAGLYQAAIGNEEGLFKLENYPNATLATLGTVLFGSITVGGVIALLTFRK